MCREDEQLSSQVRRVHLAAEVMHTSRGSGELDRRLRLRLHDLFNPEVFEIEAVGVFQLIDKREHYFIPLVYREAGGIPNLGAVEGIVDQGKFSLLSGYLADSQSKHCEEHYHQCLHNSPLP